MPLFQVLAGLGELAVGLLAESRLGAVGVALLFLIGAWTRARRDGLAVGAAVVPALLTVQA